MTLQCNTHYYSIAWQGKAVVVFIISGSSSVHEYSRNVVEDAHSPQIKELCTAGDLDIQDLLGSEE